MKCHICDSDTDTITWDKFDGTFSPCSECQEAIFDCMATYEPLEDNDDEFILIEDSGCH